MGKRTSIYLDDDLAERVASANVSLSELVRRGLGVEPPDMRMAQGTAVLAAEVVRDDVRRIVREEIRSALREARGGEW